jgi:hypothetical protein
MLSSIDGNITKAVWHKKFFDASKSWLSQDEYQAMLYELNRIVQKSIDDNSNIVVAGFIPGSNWSGTVWEPIYLKACRYEEDHSAQFFGLLVCQVLIDRKETWYFIKQDVARSMIYFRIPEEKKITAGIDDLKNKFEE